jgi:hypothetical protein
MPKSFADKPIKFKVGDTTFMKCVGYGVTSYESGENVASVRKGVISLEQRDTKYDATTGQPIDRGSLGLTCSICVTQKEIDNAEKYIAENDT